MYEIDIQECSQRLRTLRKERKLSHAALSELTGIGEQTLKNYEQAAIHGDADFGKATDRTRAIGGMSIKNLYKLAKLLNVSSDYLIGLAEVPSSNMDVRAICEYTGLTESAVDSLRFFSSKNKHGIYPAGFTENDLSPIECINLILDDLGDYFFVALVDLCEAVQEKLAPTIDFSKLLEERKKRDVPGAVWVPRCELGELLLTRAKEEFAKIVEYLYLHGISIEQEEFVNGVNNANDN